MSRIHTISIPFLMQLFFFGSKACSDTLPQTPTNGKLKLVDGSVFKAYITGLNDSSIAVVKKKHWQLGEYNRELQIAAADIHFIQKRNRGEISRFAAFSAGALAGTFLGLQFFLGQCDDPDGDCSFFDRLASTRDLGTSIAISFGLGGLAGIISLFSGKNARKKFLINCDTKNLVQHRSDLLYY